jgi:regulator of replication initiation timing
MKRFSTTSGSVPSPTALMQDYAYGGTFNITVSGLTPGSYGLWFFGHGDVVSQTGNVTVNAANGGGTGSTANSALGPLKSQIRSMSLEKALHEKEEESLRKEVGLWSERHSKLIARYSEVDPVEFRCIKQKADEFEKQVGGLQQKLDSALKEGSDLKESLSQRVHDNSSVEKELENERGRTFKLSEKMRDWDGCSSSSRLATQK